MERFIGKKFFLFHFGGCSVENLANLNFVQQKKNLRIISHHHCSTGDAHSLIILGFFPFFPWREKKDGKGVNYF